MESPYAQLEDLPDEILSMIFKKLDNCYVLYSFMGLNQRFDKILNGSICIKNLTLIKSIDISLYQSTDTILDRFCLEILSKIHDKIEQINIEPSFLDRILLTNYPNLRTITLYNIPLPRTIIPTIGSHRIRIGFQ
jgi:hypothetical protein